MLRRIQRYFRADNREGAETVNDISSGAIVTGRIRLARNLKNYRFFSSLSDRAVAREIVERTFGALSRFGNFRLYSMDSVDPLFKEELKERYLISEALRQNEFSGAVAVHEAGSFSVMINEEDHIREQYLFQSGDLMSAYKNLANLDRWLDKYLRFAKSERWGYLTACPTNLGTGLRASVMMFLPALTRMNYVSDLCERAASKGLTVRGAFGEGSRGQSCLYQVSNEVTLGRKETSIISDVQSFIAETAESECETQRVMYADDKITVEDYIFRSLGILSNCRRISYDEFSEHFANVKLGAMLGLIEVENVKALDDLLVTARPAVLSKLLQAGNGYSLSFTQDENRATYVRNCINRIIY